MNKFVWLVSYPKSGNTWFRIFLANYLKDSKVPLPFDDIQNASISSSALDFEEETGLNPFELSISEVENFRPDLYRSLSLNAADDSIFKKTHDAYTYNKNGHPIFPEDISQCAVYFVRNPLDVCVSYANHSASKIEKTVAFLLNQNARAGGYKGGQLGQKLLSWDLHYKSWNEQKAIPIHTVRYEDMLQNPMETFGSIVKFLQMEYDEERLARAIINSDFKLLQKMENEKGFKERLQHCEQFFWKGAIGNYKNYLTQDQIDRIVNNCHDVMKQLGYIDSKGILTV
ncbi:MAG: sulfotransferase domain-containing protein [Bacteroidales bacterium]|nr:sulfotransferase domain-containing protein [Bacteroidales bacterium]